MEDLWEKQPKDGLTLPASLERLGFATSFLILHKYCTFLNHLPDSQSPLMLARIGKTKTQEVINRTFEIFKVPSLVDGVCPFFW